MSVWPLGARAQQLRLPTIGYLGSASPDAWATRLQAFREGLSETGFEENRNVAIEYRWAEANLDRLPQLASDLVARNVAILVTPGSAPAALAAKAATTTIPIVFETGADPVAAGIVSNLNRPGGNITGIAALTFETAPKRLEILHEALPDADPIAVVFNPSAGDVVERQRNEVQRAAQHLGFGLLLLTATDNAEVDRAFATMQERRIKAALIISDPFMNSRVEKIAGLALGHAVATIFFNPQFVEAGGFMSYGGNITETHRLAGIYVGRILKGEKPADLPVIQGTKMELIVNLRTAKALGLTLPLPLLGRADEVIE